MTRFEFLGTPIDVPDGWHDITLGHYETFCGDDPQTARDRVALVAKICGTDVERLLDWPAEVFNRIVEHIGFVFDDNPAAPCPSVEIGGVRYVVPIEDELTLGAWVDADDVQKRGERVLSGILAIVCRPAGEKYDDRNNESRQAMFAALPVSTVLPVLAFFLRCKTAFDQRTEAYMKIAEVIDRLPRSFGDFAGLGGGTKLLRIWPIIRLWVLTASLRYRWHKFTRFCSTSRTATMRSRRSGDWIRRFRKQ